MGSPGGAHSRGHFGVFGGGGVFWGGGAVPTPHTPPKNLRERRHLLAAGAAVVGLLAPAWRRPQVEAHQRRGEAQTAGSHLHTHGQAHPRQCQAQARLGRQRHRVHLPARQHRAVHTPRVSALAAEEGPAEAFYLRPAGRLLQQDEVGPEGSGLGHRLAGAGRAVEAGHAHRAPLRACGIPAPAGGRGPAQEGGQLLREGGEVEQPGAKGQVWEDASSHTTNIPAHPKAGQEQTGSRPNPGRDERDGRAGIGAQGVACRTAEGQREGERGKAGTQPIC